MFHKPRGAVCTRHEANRFVGLRNRKYGRTVLGIYVRSPSGKLDLTPHSEEFVSLTPLKYW